MDKTVNNPLEDRVLTLKRTFDAPLQLVWDAWTQAEHIVGWWGPQGMDTKVESLDFRPGGQWRYVMKMPNGQDFVGEGTFVEIVAPERLVMTADFKPMTEGVVLTTLLEEMEGKTQMTFSVTHRTAEYMQQQAKMGFESGWGSTFSRLEEYLSRLA